MTKNLNELKDHLHKQLESASAKVEAIKANANVSLEEAKEKIQKKKLDVEISLVEIQEKAKNKKEEVQSSLEEFNTERNEKRAIRRAKHAEEYALSSIALVHAAIQEADYAIADAIIAAAEAEAFTA